LAPAFKLTRSRHAVNTICDLVAMPVVQTALEKGSDTARAFAVRAIKRLLSEEKRPPWEILKQLRTVMDDYRDSAALQTGRSANPWTKRPPAR
jgi:hypothetical protein